MSRLDEQQRRWLAAKKELIGNFKNPGQEWTQQAEAVNLTHRPISSGIT